MTQKVAGFEMFILLLFSVETWMDFSITIDRKKIQIIKIFSFSDYNEKKIQIDREDL